VNNLPKVVTQLLPEKDMNPRPVDRKCNALPTAPPRHLKATAPVCGYTYECMPHHTDSVSRTDVTFPATKHHCHLANTMLYDTTC